MNYTINLVILLTSILVATSCHELKDPLIPVDPDQVIQLELVSKDSVEMDLSNLLADSVSSRLVAVTLRGQSDPGQIVSLKTTDGVLTTAGERPNSSSSQVLMLTPTNRELLFQVNALDLPNEQVVLTGTVGTISNFVELSFNYSFASDFQILPSAAVLPKEDTLSVIVSAFTKYGVVSEGTSFKVSVEAPDSIVINYPLLVSLKNQKSNFKIMNVSKKAGTISLKVKMPVNDENIDSLERKIAISYQ